MSFRDWVRTSGERIAEHGVRGAVVSAQELWMGVLRRVGKRYGGGESPYERDWDVLVILDACRHDALQSVAEEGRYDWLPEDVPSIWSCASQSPEFVDEAFDIEAFGEKLSRTALVTANSYPGLRLPEGTFARHIDVSERAWDSDLGTVHPEAVTDHAIAAWREAGPDVDRLVVWYLQPHVPYRSDAVPTDPSSEPPFGDDTLSTGGEVALARDGVVDHETVWNAYVDNLHWVLDDVARLRENVAADRMVVTADHGEAFGDLGVWGHPRYVPTPALRRVPWVEIESSDTGSSQPNVSLDDPAEADTSVEERLEALGYRDGGA